MTKLHTLLILLLTVPFARADISEEFNRCTLTPEQRQELSDLTKHYEAIMRSPERLQQFCTPDNRARIAPLYPRDMHLLQEMENIRNRRSEHP